MMIGKVPSALFLLLQATVVLAGPAWKPLPTTGGVDYQLGGVYAPDPRVTIVARDSTAKPAAGLYNICYVNGFQTQPDTLEWWDTHYPNAVLRDQSGNAVADPGWPDEYALDTRTPAARAEIAAAVGTMIDDCANAGFDAVEFDNLDSWSRFDGLTVEGNLRLAALLVEKAHGLGLAAGQKNSPDLGARGPAVGFDFVISEECALWNECAAYGSHYGERHIDIEYIGALPQGADFNALCTSPDQPALTVLRDRLLVAQGRSGYVFDLCDPEPT